MPLSSSELGSYDEKVRCLGTLILNGVHVASGELFPIGWSADTRERIYDTATESMLLAATQWSWRYEVSTTIDRPVEFSQRQLRASQ